jgi:ankyrin repeat protein
LLLLIRPFTWANSIIESQLVQLVQSAQTRIEDHWLGAEGPDYPLQTKYQASFREQLAARLPELLAAGGHTGGLQTYSQRYGEKILTRRHTNGWSPLDWAASMGQANSVKFLIQFYNQTGKSHALLWAGQNGQFQVLEELLCSGADPCFRHPTGDSVIHFASRCGQNKVIQWILHQFGGQISTEYQTFFGQYTVLHEAVDCGQFLTVQMLIKEGCDVNALSVMHETPLMLAVKENGTKDHRNCMQILLQNGADASLLDQNRKTVFDHASKNPACLLMLVQNGAIPDTRAKREIVDKVITLKYARELQEDIVSIIKGHDPGNMTPSQFQSKINDSRKMRQKGYSVLLNFRQRKFHQHGTVLVWTSEALHLIEKSVTSDGQAHHLGMVDAYLHLQLLYSNLQQQTSWNETSNTVLLLKEKDGQFSLETEAY